MTFNEMVVALQDHLGITGETTLVERLINQGKDRYVHAGKWPHLESSDTQFWTTDRRAYAAPVLCESLVALEDSSGNRVLRQERDTYDELYRADASDAVEPSVYTEEGTDTDAIHQFHVWPKPSSDTEGKVRFLVRVPDLTSTTGTFDHIPEAHHFAILKAAEIEFHEFEGQMDKAVLSEQQFIGMIRQLSGQLIAPVFEEGGGK